VAISPLHYFDLFSKLPFLPAILSHFIVNLVFVGSSYCHLPHDFNANEAHCNEKGDNDIIRCENGVDLI
jgi:hypothetical protein